MGLVRHGAATVGAVLTADGAAAGANGATGDAADERPGREERVAVSGSVGGAVRTDLDVVFRRDYRLVVGVAARVLGSLDRAEDVAQDVFLSFGRSAVPAADARGWLCVAAAHTALNLLRSGRRRAAREETAATAHDDVVADVAEAVVTLEERRRMRAALARLPRKQAVALVLRHSGLSYADVAAALDLAPGSVGTTVRRAESALRKELSRDAPSD
jgi:RNA polymerase sigma factor (sigma-70 family)